MKNRAIVAIVVGLALGFSLTVQGQLGWVTKAAREMVEAIVAKGGQQAARELAEMGGEVVAREALEKAAQEGGEKMAQRLVSCAIENGPALLKVAKSSPSKFLATFEELSPAMQKAAGQAMVREPELMAKLFANLGQDVITVAARHPGVGTQAMEVLGPEGAKTLTKLTTDDAIQLTKLAPKLSKIADSERRSLLEMIGEAPGKVMGFLEKHPKVLYTTAGVVSFIAVKEQLFGNVELVTDENGVVQSVEQRGFFERAVSAAMDKFRLPLTGLFLIVGIILLGWGGIKLWGTYKIEQAKIRIKRSQLTREARQGREQSNSNTP